MYYDTHAHLDYPEFAPELHEVIARAKAAGVARMLSIGTDIESSRRAIGLAERFPEVYAVAGWHPSYVTEAPEEVAGLFRPLLSHPKVVAVGETGLDYSRLPSKNGGTAEDDDRYKTRQRVLFEQQLALAVEAGLNVVIHQRDALEDTIAILEPLAGKLRAVFHCFVENGSVRDRLRQMGFLVSFTGIVTFKNAQVVQQTAQSSASDGYMLETDCPYLAPVPYRGKRCEPAHVAEIAKKIAELRGCEPEEVGRSTCETAHKFFPKLG